MTTQKNDGCPGKTKVAIIDDHPLVREAIIRAIDGEADLEVCGSAATVDDALRLLQRQKVDIILVDLSLRHSSGFVLLEILKRDYPNLASIVLSMHEETTHAVKAIKKGARGYIMKKESLETIINAIRHVLSGKIWLKEELLQQALSDSADTSSDPQSIPTLLTPRELEIFEMIGNGIPVEKIAKKLFISKRTVQSHRDHIKVKLNIPRISGLHHAAFQWVKEKA